jgi:hypothetical protein
VQVTAPANLEERSTDRDGVVNARFAGGSMEARMVAMSLTTSNVLAKLKLQGSGADRGRSLASGSKPLNIFSAGMFIRLNGAALKSAPVAFNMREDRVRELTFTSTRVVTGGTVADVGVDLLLRSEFPAAAGRSAAARSGSRCVRCAGTGRTGALPARGSRRRRARARQSTLLRRVRG